MVVSINEREPKVQPQIIALKVALLTQNLKQVSRSRWLFVSALIRCRKERTKLDTSAQVKRTGYYSAYVLAYLEITLSKMMHCDFINP